jgi:hypothetical protein
MEAKAAAKAMGITSRMHPQITQSKSTTLRGSASTMVYQDMSMRHAGSQAGKPIEAPYRIGQKTHKPSALRGKGARNPHKKREA